VVSAALSVGVMVLICLVGLLWRKVVQRLASEEGCAGLVVSNFGGRTAARGGRRGEVKWARGACCPSTVGGHGGETKVRHKTSWVVAANKGSVRGSLKLMGWS
jgi:hypothetical protein